MLAKDVEKPKYKIGDLVVVGTIIGGRACLLHRIIKSAWFHLDDDMTRGWEYSLDEAGDTAYMED